jgi:hypothetical protein
MLLCLIKHPRPIVICLVPKCMVSENVATHKEIIRVIEFVLDTRDTCIKLNPKSEDEKWDLIVFNNSSCARDNDNNISVIRLVKYWFGSRFNEVGYVAMTEVMREIQFFSESHGNPGQVQY